VPNVRIPDLSMPTGFPLVLWLLGSAAGTTVRVAHIYASGTSGSPDTVTYPAASYPPGSKYYVTDSTPPMAVFVNDGTNWVRLDAVPDISVHVTHSVAQSIATNTGTILAFDTERYDTDGMHDAATNNTRLTAKSPGRYLVWGGVGFGTSTTGYRQGHIVKNGSLGLLAMRIASLADSYLSIATIATLAVGDYVELQVRQTSGGALDVLKSAGETTPEFGMTRIAP
jgi:hypothetical protein